MRVLVTGGAGFVGTNLIKKLLSEGHRVVSLDNYSTGKKENELDIKGVQYFDVDLLDTFDYDFFIDKPDIIFHLAAIARIQPSFEHPDLTYHANVSTTLNVLEWARKKKCPVVFSGSSSSNGDKFANPYTLSKSHAENLVKLYNKIYDIPTTICRFYNVYGPYQLTEGDYCTLIGIFERLKKENKVFTVTGDGTQRRDFTHVDDIVDGLIKCHENLDKSNGHIFELGRGKNYSVSDIVDAFGEDEVEYLPKRPGEMRETLCTDTKAREMLGWTPKKDVIEFIKETYILDK